MDKLKKFLTDNKDVFMLFALSRLLFAAVLLIAQRSYGDVLLLFDAEHYRNVAAIGYREEYMAACFPMAPLFIRFLGHVGAVIVNHIAFFFSLYLAYFFSAGFDPKSSSFRSSKSLKSSKSSFGYSSYFFFC